MTTKELSINCASKNSVWIYPLAMSQRFSVATEIGELVHTLERPDIFNLPEGSDVTVELYGGACVLWLEGGRRRVHIRRFDHITFSSEEEARHAFMRLWREVETLESPAEIQLAAERWLASSRG
jgi:hypothetical protein